MTIIKELPIGKFETIFEQVQLLLTELREEPSQSADQYKDKILADWKRRPDQHVVFAAYDDDIIVGIITLSESFAIYAEGYHGIINELYVTPDYRSGGIGQLLLERAKKYAKERSWLRIEVTAPAGEKWERTVAFYLREGFQSAGPKLRYFT